MLLQHGSRLKAEYDGNELQTIYVHGKEYDWKLTNDRYKSEIQMVKTYVYQPKMSDEQFNKHMFAHRGKLEEWEAVSAQITQLNEEKMSLYDKDENGKYIDVPNEVLKSLEAIPAKPIEPNNDWSWRGPICIDNMTRDSPLGDQFAARALALLNDTFTIKIVSTIGRYLIKRPNSNKRVDFDEM